MMKNKMISIIMPCFNEGSMAAKGPLKTAEILRENLGNNFEIIIVNDGSKDDTQTHINQAVKQDANIKQISYETNRGKGFAVKKGAAEAKGNLIGFIDSDLEICPTLIPQYIQTIDNENTDIVIGSKYHPNSKLDRQKRRQILSKMSNKMIELLFQLKGIDSQVGLKVFKKEVAHNILKEVKTNSFAFDIEFLVLAKKEQYKIHSAPVYINQMNDAASNVQAGSIIKTFLDTMKLHRKMKKHIKPNRSNWIRVTLLATIFIPLEYLFKTVSEV